MKYFKTYESFKKTYGQKTSPADFKKIQVGKEVLYMGTPYEVVSNNGYILNLKGEDGDMIKVNLGQFNHGGQVNESIINEGTASTFLVLAHAALVAGQLALLGNKISAGGGSTSIEDLKKWWQKRKSDKAVKSIIDKIKDDKDVVEFMKLTPSQQRGKFRSLIATKLNDEELEYLSRINRSHFQNESTINEAARVPSNIMDFAKRKGSYAVNLVKKAATWAEKAGKYISGGTAIGKNYDTIILDMKYQGAEIYINLNNETIKLFGEEVTDPRSFKKVLDANNANESILNEGRSIEKIEKDRTVIIKDMAETVTNWKASKSSGDKEAEASFLLRLKDLTARKNNLEKELTSAVSGKDRFIELVISEKLNESMSDVDIIAQEAKDFKTFVKEFKKEYKNMDTGNPKELEAWLKGVYDDAKENMNEEVNIKKTIHDHWFDTYGKQFITEYPGIAHILKTRPTITRDELARIWDETHEENFEKTHPKIWDKLG